MATQDTSAERLVAEAAAEAERKLEVCERKLIEDSLSVEVASEFTGASEARLREMIRKREVLVVVDGDEILLPGWQLRKNELYPIDLKAVELDERFHGTLGQLHDWMKTPHPDLDGDTPEEAFKDGHTSVVLGMASAIAAAGR